ncbi:hypothetical protein F2P44_06515 [Massilia sp. CCM 8695]|uniref:Probable zinc-binding domain-containing protein n=1 Tax=Massilia frigida TaxID=2609281 RepID=A0ABX0N0Y0_9BURK|nr:zinc-ribbon domain containing protein [Massilia frigida]NHZ78933.1 hypothetical protein [Massilia frigida]
MTSPDHAFPDLRPACIPAEPERWSAKSKTSLPYQLGWVKHYTDKAYVCRTCGTSCVFTAQDQMYAYEVKKAYIDQQRTLCRPCWNHSNDIAAQLRSCASKWAEEKTSLNNNVAFLTEWLELLKQRERYIFTNPDTAQKNMLIKLIRQAAAPALSSSPRAPS